MDQNKTDNRQSFLRAYGIYSGMGMQLVVAVILGVLGGKYLDEKLDTLPLFLIIGVILGTVAGFLTLFRTYKKYSQKR